MAALEEDLKKPFRAPCSVLRAPHNRPFSIKYHKHPPAPHNRSGFRMSSLSQQTSQVSSGVITTAQGSMVSASSLLTVPLSALPAQTLKVSLSGTLVQITLRQRSTGLYADLIPVLRGFCPVCCVRTAHGWCGTPLSACPEISCLPTLRASRTRTQPASVRVFSCSTLPSGHPDLPHSGSGSRSPCRKPRSRTALWM